MIYPARCCFASVLRKTGFVFLITVFLPLQTSASTDSLLTVFRDVSQPDSVRVKAIHFAAWNLIYVNTDSTRLLAELEIEFAARKDISMWRMPDQFGGDPSFSSGGKKFKSSNLKRLILEIKDLPLAEESNRLTAELEKWKGEFEQVDDVCVIGVRL